MLDRNMKLEAITNNEEAAEFFVRGLRINRMAPEAAKVSYDYIIDDVYERFFGAAN